MTSPVAVRHQSHDTFNALRYCPCFPLVEAYFLSASSEPLVLLGLLDEWALRLPLVRHVGMTPTWPILASF